MNLRRGAGLLAFAVVAFVFAPAIASAQTTNATITVELVSQSSFVVPGQDFRIDLRITGANPTDMVSTVVYPMVRSRAELRGLVDGTVSLRNPLISYQRAYQQLLDPATQRAVITIPPGTATKGAVYPISITVGSGSRATKPIITTLIRTADLDPEGGPLRLSLVLPVQSPTALQPDQLVSIPPGERDRLTALATTFAADFPTLPVTFAPNPETLDALDRASPDDRAVLEMLKQAARGRGVLGTTFVPVDEEAWRSSGLGAELTGQFNNGLNTIARTLGSTQSSIVTDVALTDRSDTAETLGLRRAFGANRVVIDESGLEPLNEQRFSSTVLQTFVVSDTSGNELRTMAADRRLSALARSVADPALAARRPLLAQQFLADLAAAYYDHPRLARGTVIVLPDNWAMNPTIHDVLLPALTSAPMLRLLGLDALFATINKASPAGPSVSETSASGPLRRTLKPDAARALGDYPTQLARVTNKLTAFEAMLGTATSARSTDLHDLLNVSADDRLDASDRRAYLNAVDEAITKRLLTADGRPGIVAPGKQRITMTSRRTEIPLQLENQLSYPVTVRLELRSEKLDFPNGWIATETLQPGSNAVSVVVRSRTSGDSLLEVTVLAPGADASIGQLATTQFRVRSTALSGVGLALSIVALLVLLTWWIRHARRTRRTRRMAETVIDLGSRSADEREAVTTTLHESLGTGTER